MDRPSLGMVCREILHRSAVSAVMKQTELGPECVVRAWEPFRKEAPRAGCEENSGPGFGNACLRGTVTLGRDLLPGANR